MAANSDALVLFNNLIQALDNERAAIEAKDMVLLEKTGAEIAGILKDIEAGTPADGTDRFATPAAEASRKRKENTVLLKALLDETGKELGRVRRGRQVQQAYSGSGHTPAEIYVKKDC